MKLIRARGEIFIYTDQRQQRNKEHEGSDQPTIRQGCEYDRKEVS